MKKISVLFAFLLVAAVTFVGCKKDEAEKAAPTITFSGSDAGNGSVEIDFSIADPKSLVFNVNIAAEGEISTFTITKKIYASTTTTSQLTATGYDGKTSFTYNFDQSFTAAAFADVTKIEYIFDVTDKQDPAMSVSKTFTVTEKEITVNPINSYPSLSLTSAYNAPTAAEYVNAISGVTYNHSATSANTATFGFVSGGGNGATFLASASGLSLTSQPASWATAAKLATTTVTATEFDAIANEDDLLAKVPSSITSDYLNHFEDGGANASVEVFAFEVNNKKGLVKVQSSMDNTADQAVTISIKVQQ